MTRPVPNSVGNRATTSARSIARLKADEDIESPLAREIGSKGYHDRVFGDGAVSRRVTVRAIRRIGQTDVDETEPMR